MRVNKARRRRVYHTLSRHLHEHLSSRFKPQFLAALNCQQAGAPGAAYDQSDSRAFAAAGNAADDCAGRGANTAALQRLVAAAL